MLEGDGEVSRIGEPLLQIREDLCKFISIFWIYLSGDRDGLAEI